MAIGRVGIRQNVNLLLDSDAQAFITAAGLSSDTHKNAVNELVKDLKSANLWTKMKAVYPMVGGTAATHKWNLKDPRDVNAAFRLSFYGGGTHGPNGYQLNGTDAYASTNLIPSGNLNQNDNHYTIYSRTQATSSYSADLMAASSNVGYSNPWGHYDKYQGGGYGTNLFPYNSTLDVSNYTANAVQDMGETKGLIANSRQSSSQFSVYKNGSYLQFYKSSAWRDAIYNATSNALTTNPVQIGVWGSTGANSISYRYFSYKQYAFASIGDGLSNTEMTILYRIIEKFQAALGRNVNATLPFYYNNSYDLNTNLFFFNAGITNATQQSAVGTLVNTLTTAGIWSKMKAVYPFVGGNATSHRFNLVDSSTYTLTFAGGWTHSSTGALPNGSTGYANTFLKPFGTLNPNSLHMSYYGRTDILTGRQLMGSALSYPLIINHSYSNVTGNITFNSNAGQNSTLSVQTQNKPSLIMLNRQNSTLFNFLKRGVVLGSNTNGGVISLPNTTGGGSPGYIYLGSTFRAVTAEMTYTNLECAFASIGDGLTDAEVTTFYNAVQAFQTTLGRQV